MALTITQQPSQEDLANRKLMLAATSTNVANIGFKYRVIVTTTQGANSFWIPPNPSGAAIIDLAQLVKLNNMEINSGVSIHKFVTSVQEVTGNGAIYSYTVSVQEAWEVAGVLTLQGSATNLSYSMMWNGCLQASDPQTTNLSTRYLLNGSTKRFLSDREYNTSPWLYANLHNFTPGTDKVFIPVRELDYGVMTLAYLRTKTVTKIRVIVYEDDGTPHTGDIDVTTHPESTMWHYPVYPANLNINTISLPKPSDYPNWPFLTVQALNASNAAQSVLYVLYNVNDKVPLNCIYDNVRLAWKGFGGSWEYQNFTKRSIKEYQIERKQYRKVLGTYGTSYTMIGQERGLTEVDIVAPQILSATSDWLSEGEFEFLTGLFTSRQVMIVNDNGTHTPVVVEDSGYAEKKERNGKLYNQTIRVKYSNNLWV